MNNKWFKHGVTGLILGGATLVTTQLAGSSMKAEFLSAESAVSMDAMDLAGGSKLKDRMIVSENDDLALVYAYLNA